MILSRLREVLKKDFVLGTWSQSASPEVLEILGYTGYDFTIIDTEHGYYGLETAENLVRTSEAAGIPSIIRVAVNQPHLIMKALDIGAQGVLVPQITSQEEAIQVIQSAKYNPLGNRGACPCIRVGQHRVKEWERFSTKSNENAYTMVIIEGDKGFQNVEEIIKTDHLDAVMIGPFDMSVSLGLGGDLNHPKIIEFMKKVISLGEKYNVDVFLPNFDLNPNIANESINKWKEIGAKYFTVGTDKLLISQHFENFQKTIKGGEDN